MKILVADPIGFCKGVEAAVSLAERLLRKRDNETIQTLGDLIHNPLEVKRLASLGVKPISDLSQGGGILILRTHGTPPEVAAKARELGYELVEAACPKVLKAQKRVREFREKGLKIFIAGSKGHPETDTLLALSGPDGVALESAEELDSIELDPDARCALVAQTTADRKVFERCAEVLRSKCGDVKVSDTLCKAVDRRIEAGRKLAAGSDLMIIVGGRNSANTKRLFDAVSEINPKTVLIETVDELERVSPQACLEPCAKQAAPVDLSGVKTVGIASGASTPQWLLDAVIEKLRGLG